MSFNPSSTLFLSERSFNAIKKESSPEDPIKNGINKIIDKISAFFRNRKLSKNGLAPTGVETESPNSFELTESPNSLELKEFSKLN